MLVIVLWVVTIALIIMVLGLSKRVQDLDVIVRGDSGAEIAPAAGVALDLGWLGAAEFGEAFATAVLFLGAGCVHCDRLLAEFRRQETGIEESLGVRVVIATDDVDAASAIGASRVYDDDGTIRERFKVKATPVAVAVDQTGRVLGSGPVPSVQAFRELVAAAQGEGAQIDVSVVGSDR